MKNKPVRKNRRQNQSPPSSRPEEGRDYYMNENEMLVFTATYLLNRGACCGNGCLHCPYNSSS
ncbi:MAG: DUF5522 domain-containing protein [Balneolaceae bacterium]